MSNEPDHGHRFVSPKGWPPTIAALRLVVAFLLAGVPLAAQVLNPTNGHTFMLTPTTMTYVAARAYANSVGGYLVAINDAAENAFVTSNFAVIGDQPWFGLTDEIQEGVFRWDSGEVLNFTNWSPGEPDNYLGAQDHAELQFNGSWADLQGDYVKFGIIEIPASGPDAALAFDGINDRVTIPSNNILSGASDFTIEAWVKITSVPMSFSTMIVKQDNPTALRPFLLSALQGQVHLSINYEPYSNTHALYAVGTANIIGAWHHLAFRRQAGQVQLFIDGNVETFDNGQTSIACSAPIAATSAPIVFGDEPYTQKLAGHLDDVRIWNVARAQAEIQSNMHQCLAGTELGLVGYWPLDDGAVAPGTQFVTDRSPTAASGFLGSSNTVGADDPTWTMVNTAPVTCPTSLLGPFAAGNVGAVSGGPFDVVVVNGSSGAPTRQVDVAVNAPITISISQPPTSSAPAAFVLYGFIGVPAPSDAVTLPLGIGTMAFMPYTLNPAYPGAFQVASSFQPDPVSLVAGTLTPWSYTKVTGIHFPFQMTFQAVMLQYPVTFEVSNGVILNVL